MDLKQKYNSCKNFRIHNLCPHSEDKLMREFIANLELQQLGISTSLDVSKETEVNKVCSSCGSFKPLNLHIKSE